MSLLLLLKGESVRLEITINGLSTDGWDVFLAEALIKNAADQAIRLDERAPKDEPFYENLETIVPKWNVKDITQAMIEFRVNSKMDRRTSKDLSEYGIVLHEIREGSLIIELTFLLVPLSIFVAVLVRQWILVSQQKYVIKSLQKYCETGDRCDLIKMKEIETVYQQTAKLELFGPKTLELMRAYAKQKNASLESIKSKNRQDPELPGK